jgi:hypothetical protein
VVGSGHWKAGHAVVAVAKDLYPHALIVLRTTHAPVTNICTREGLGSGTMLQAGRSRIPFQARSLDLSIKIILPAAPQP